LKVDGALWQVVETTTAGIFLGALSLDDKGRAKNRRRTSIDNGDTRHHSKGIPAVNKQGT